MISITKVGAICNLGRNIDEIFTESIQEILLTKNIAVIGCGG